ncbi:MAG: ferredoxin [Actinomycetota bacterium]
MPQEPQALTVDMIACAGHGICAELLPEWVRLDDWGYPIIRPGAIPPGLLAQAKWAVSNCPTLALKLRKALQEQPAPGRS